MAEGERACSRARGRVEPCTRARGEVGRAPRGRSPPPASSAAAFVRGVRRGLPRLGVTEPNGRARKDAEGAAEGRAREGVARTVQAEEGRVAEEEDEVPVAHNRQPRLVSGRLSVHKLCPLALCGEWATTWALSTRSRGGGRGEHLRLRSPTGEPTQKQ